MQFQAHPQPVEKNTLIKIIFIWVILGVIGGIGFKVYNRIKDMPLSAEIVEEEEAFSYAPEEVEDSNPFEEYTDEGYRYGIHRMKEEEYIEEFDPSTMVAEGDPVITEKPVVVPTPKPKDRVHPPVISQFKDPDFGSIKVIEIEDSEPIVAFKSPTSVTTTRFTEPVLVSLITTIGATLNTLLLVFKKKN